MKEYPKWSTLKQHIDQRGWRWLLGRIWFELISPQYGLSSRILSFVRKRFRSRRVNDLKKIDAGGGFLACYTLSDEITSFDFAYFLARAEVEAAKAGFSNFRVALVRRSRRDVTGNTEEDPDDDLRGEVNATWRLMNIVIPLVGLYPNCKGFQLVEDSVTLQPLVQHNMTFPTGYSWRYFPGLDYKEIFCVLASDRYSGFAAPPKALQIVEDWLAVNKVRKPLVTITLRQRKWDSERNSSLKDWARFGHWLNDRGFSVVVVPDTDTRNPQIQDYSSLAEYPEASWNIAIRLALYETAVVNFGVNNGPMALMHLSKNVSYVQTFFTSGSEIVDDGKYYSEVLGVEVGDLRLPFGRVGQVLSWGSDDFDSLCRGFLIWEADVMHQTQLESN